MDLKKRIEIIKNVAFVQGSLMAESMLAHPERKPKWDELVSRLEKILVALAEEDNE